MTRLLQRVHILIKPAIAIVAAFVIGAILLFAAGYNVFEAFSSLWDSVFENIRNFTVTLNRSSPIIFTGLSVAIAFRGNTINMGAEGQFLAGTIMATIVGLGLPNLPALILIPLMIIAGALGGAVWATIPGLLKIRFKVSEIITTIMFNYIALHLVGYLVRGPLRDVSQAEPQSYPIAEQGFLPKLVPGTSLHFGYFLGVIVALLVYYLLFKTYIGYEVRAVGQNLVAAQTAGISAEQTILKTILFSAALAGIGGAIELASVHYLIEGISPGHGWTGVAVSVLALNHPIGIIFTSFLFGALSSGATAMQRSAGVSASFVEVFQGIMIIGIALATISSGKSRRRKEVNRR